MATNNSLRADLGRVTIEVNDAGETISFVPDVHFISRVQDAYKFLRDREAAEKEVQAELSKVAEASAGEGDAADILESVGPQLERAKLAYDDVDKMIDSVFGPEASRKVFGDERSMLGYYDFFQKVMPFIEQARKPLVDKHMQQMAAAPNREERRAAGGKG